MSAATNYTEANALNYLLTTTALTGNNARPTAWYVGLMTAIGATPEAGTGMSEVSGGSYIRQSVAFTVATAGDGTTTAKNSATITFPQATADWGTITHVGIWTAQTSGTMLFYGTVTANKVISNGDTFQITADNLSISLA